MSYSDPQTIDDVMNRVYANLHWFKITLRQDLEHIRKMDEHNANLCDKSPQNESRTITNSLLALQRTTAHNGSMVQRMHLA